MGSAEFNMKWKLFLNGLIQAVYAGAISSLAVLVVNGVFVLGMPPAALGMVVLGSIIGAVVGYFQRSPLPPVFDVDVTKDA